MRAWRNGLFGENRCLSGCFSGILTFRGRPTRGLILILAALGYNLLVRQWVCADFVATYKKQAVFLRVRYFYFLLLGWTFGTFEILEVGRDGYWNFVCQNVLCFLAQKVAIINYIYFVNTCLLTCCHSISCYSFFCLFEWSNRYANL